jgi:hydrogenase maturation protease
MTRSVLIAGVGNIFLADDGFGTEVVTRLSGEQQLPPGVRVADFGIRGLHLAYQLLEGYDAVILVDAHSRGEGPGTVFLLEPELEDGESVSLDAHGLDPASVLRTVKALGGSLKRVFVVGCEPAELEERIGLSKPVAQAVGPAIRLIHELVHRELGQMANGCGLELEGTREER